MEQDSRTEKYQQMRELPNEKQWRQFLALETVIELISHTTTQEGLVVTAIKDANTYPTGIKVCDEELASLHIVRDPFHGE